MHFVRFFHYYIRMVIIYRVINKWIETMKVLVILIVMLIIIKLLGINKVKLLVKYVNDYYTKNKLLIRIIIIISEVSIFLSFYRILASIYKVVNIGYFMVITLIFHYIFGYMLVIISRYNEIIGKALDSNIRGEFLTSYFIVSINILIIFISPRLAIKYIITILVINIISYLINIHILFMFIKNPRIIKLSKEDNSTFLPYLIIGIIIILMIIVNLYILVIGAYVIDINTFSNNPSMLDLLYYTIASFVTIGFGDIVPLTNLGKIVLIIISFSSVLSISIFIGGIYYNRKI